MSTITFDADKFRVQFPEFANTTDYPTVYLQGYWDQATCYISPEVTSCMSEACLERALFLMTAHLIKIGEDTTAGDDPAFVSSASIDKVSVSVVPPPQRDQWEWWLNLTSYGQQLLALLKSKAVGGLYIGGSLERLSFRKAGGVFYG